MNTELSTPPKARSRAGALRKLGATMLAVSLAMVPVLGTATAAEAATKHHGFQGGSGAGSGWLGDVELDEGFYAFCIDPAGLFPSGNTAGATLVTEFNGTTREANPGHNDTRDVEGANIRRLNAALWQFGEPTSDRAAAAMGAYVYSITSAAHNGSDVSYYIDKRVTDPDDNAAVKDRYRTIRDWVADNYTASSTLKASVNITITNDATLDGYVDVRTSSNAVAATLTLKGATLRGSSATSVTVENGDRVLITAQRGSDNKYAVTAGVRVTGPWVYSTNVRVYKTGSTSDQMQRVVRRGDRDRSVIVAQAFVTDPLPGEFEPVLTTTVDDQTLSIGDDFTDIVTADVNDPAFPWQTAAGGSYIPIRADGTVYGPFADQPVQSDGVPEGSPVAGTTSLTLNGPGEYTASVPNAAGQSGYYTWVWEIYESDQSAPVRDVLPDDYVFVSPFGEAVETSLVAADVRVDSVVSDPETGLFQVTSDTVSVLHDGEATGLWPNDEAGVPAPVTFEGTAYFVEGNEAPARQSTIPADAAQIGTGTFTANEVGDYPAVGEVTAPGVVNGYIVWQWTVVGSDFVQEFVEDFGVPSQITRVLAPTIETEADPSVALGDTMGDTLIVSGPEMGEPTVATFEAFLRAGVAAECDPATQVIDTASTPVTVTTPGRYPSPRSNTGTALGLPVGSYDWVATLSDGDGNVIAQGECGDLDEVTVVETFALATNAVEEIEEGERMYDVATITGLVPTGATIDFAAYAQTTDVFVCAPENEFFRSAAVPAASGTIRSESVVAEEGLTYAWIATVYDRDGVVMQAGACGDPAEITVVNVPPVPPVFPPGIPELPLTGISVALPVQLSASLLFLGGLLLWWTRKTRQLPSA